MKIRMEICYNCGGSGIVTWEEENENGEIVKCVEVCGRCSGTGKIEEICSSLDED